MKWNVVVVEAPGEHGCDRYSQTGSGLELLATSTSEDAMGLKRTYKEVRIPKPSPSWHKFVGKNQGDWTWDFKQIKTKDCKNILQERS